MCVKNKNNNFVLKKKHPNILNGNRLKYLEASRKLINSAFFTPEYTGIIAGFSDGIALVIGLKRAKVGELVKVGPCRLTGTILNLERNFCRIMVMGSQALVKEGQYVSLTGAIVNVKVNESFLGRAVDALGNLIDAGEPIFTEKEICPIDMKAPGILDRQGIYESLETGIMGIDSLIPIGHGQRQLIIGDKQTGKTSIAVDAIINQGRAGFVNTAGKTPICVYVAVGQKTSDTAFLLRLLKKKRGLSYTIIVAAGAAESATLQFLAPYTGTSIAEWFMYRGAPVLIVYDDLSKHAAAYRQISLLLRRPPGREAFPGDVFYLHSRLLERSAKLKESKYIGGSLTALPIVETQASDVSAYIPTNVISITDGQIYLEADLFNKGVRPALNFGLSVSRVGSAAQCKAMKSVAGSLKLELAQYREVAAFTAFAADLDYTTVLTLKKGLGLTELLKQRRFDHIKMKAQVILIIAGVKGHIDLVAIDELDTLKTAIMRSVNINRDWLEHFDLNEPVTGYSLRYFIDWNIKNRTTLGATSSFKRSFIWHIRDGVRIFD